MKGSNKAPEVGKPVPLASVVSNQPMNAVFKSGGQLPSLVDGLKSKETVSRTKLESYYDEEDDDDEDENGDFDANKLLDFSDYKNKRDNYQRPETGKTAADSQRLPSAVGQRPGQAAGADFAVDLSDEDDEDDGWGDVDNYVPDCNDLAGFDYKNKDLNKCGDYELKKHKLNMDKDYKKNILKPGDNGFEYDKRVDFSRNKDQAVEDSWDDNDNFNDDDYFDDDFA